MVTTAAVPMQKVGPICIRGSELNADIFAPLATYETPLWASVGRGAKVTALSGGVSVAILSDCMSRSILLEGSSAVELNQIVAHLRTCNTEIADVVASSSRFAKLLDLHTQIVGKLLYLRISISTGDASGHNMVTQAADYLVKWLLQEYQTLRYLSISGNLCTDKKPSAINGILGRGKYAVAEMLIPRQICLDVLKTTPEKIAELNVKKNLIGTLLAGTVRSANAHFANMLLAFYLATGQDAANIVEGSQGIVHAEVDNGDLYFSTTIPNIIVGTVGNGKHLPFVVENLMKLGCTPSSVPGESARRLASIAAAVVFCGELSLMAAQTNQGELMQSHIKLERNFDS